jgi:hypothetical protein
MDAAVIERRDGVFERGRSRNGIEIFGWPLASVTGGIRPSWPSHIVVLLRLRRFPHMASRGERVRVGAVQGSGDDKG